MKSRIISLMLAMIAGTASGQSSSPTMAFVTIESHGYSIDKTHYESMAQLISALRAMPKLDAIGLTSLPEAGEEQVSLTMKAIQAAGITARIAIVGNDVFYK